MTLINLIKTHAAEAASAGDWDTVSVTLNALRRTTTDTTLRTARWLMDSLTTVVDPATGATEADVILGTIQSATIPRVRAAYDTLCAGGIDLSNPQVQSMIPVLAEAAGWPDGLAEKIAEAGVRLEPLIVTTAEECQSAWEYQTALDARNDRQQRFDAIQNQIGTSEQPLAIAALRAMADELEG